LTRFRSYSLEASLNLDFKPGDKVLPRGAEEGGILRKDFEAYHPASNFGFQDVSERSIASGAFGFFFDDWKRGPFYWGTQPGERHGKRANLSFLDGHVDSHPWLFPKRLEPDSGSPPANELDRQDLMWLYDRTHLGQFRQRELGLP
jgi:prepilin-type processing-associated H-X9-DG protein